MRGSAQAAGRVEAAGGPGAVAGRRADVAGGPSGAVAGRRSGAWLEQPRARAALVLLVLALILGLWQGLAASGLMPAFILPAPGSVAAALARGVSDGVILGNALVTLGESLAGFAIGCAAALLLGGLIAHSAWFRVGLYPYVVAFQAVPKVAVAPLVVVWFGFGLSSKVVMAALVSFFPVVVNVIAGLDGADAGHLELMRSVCASRWQTFAWVRWPASLPYLFAGLKVSLVFSLIGAVVGEFVGAKRGLGMLVAQMQFQMDTAGVFAALIVLSVLALGLHLLLSWVDRRVVFWTQSGPTVGA
jgi:NitT/TauT family transport system permease protein